MGPVPIDLSQAPASLAEMVVRVRDAVERSIGSVGFHPAPLQPDPRKMN